jgi:L-fuculose-phosphate aldolase
VDAYCRILILAKQLGRINYFTDGQTRELLDLKKKLGYEDPRHRMENCDLCGNNLIRSGYSDFEPEPVAFARDEQKAAECSCGCNLAASSNGQADRSANLDDLVRIVTDQVMAALAGAQA